MKAFTAALILAVAASAAPIADPQAGCSPAHSHGLCKREPIADPDPQDGCSPANPHGNCKRATPAITPWIYTGGQKREAEPTLNTRVGQFSTQACYGDWCEKKREASTEKREASANPEPENATPAITPWIYTGGEKRAVAERSAKETRRAAAKTINTRVNGSQNYTGNGKREAKTINTRVNGSQNYTGNGKREAKTINTRVNGSQNYTGNGKREAEAEELVE